MLVIETRGMCGAMASQQDRSPITVYQGVAGMIPTARVQRGPSEAARCASTEDHQLPSPHLFCEQEASRLPSPLAPYPEQEQLTIVPRHDPTPILRYP